MTTIMSPIKWMTDCEGEPFQVDGGEQGIDHLLRGKRIYTSAGQLYVEVYGALTQGGKGIMAAEKPIPVLLSRFVVEVYTLEAVSPKKTIRFKDNDPRNLCFSNLETVKR